MKTTDHSRELDDALDHDVQREHSSPNCDDWPEPITEEILRPDHGILRETGEIEFPPWDLPEG